MGRFFQVFRNLEGKGNGWNTQNGALEGRRDRSGISHIIREVAPVIDPGNNEVRFSGKDDVQREVDAVGRRSVQGVMAGVLLGNAKRLVYRQCVGCGGTFLVRSDYIDIPEGRNGLLQNANPFRRNSVVVGNKYKGSDQGAPSGIPESPVRMVRGNPHIAYRFSGAKDRKWIIVGRGERI